MLNNKYDDMLTHLSLAEIQEFDIWIVNGVYLINYFFVLLKSIIILIIKYFQFYITMQF
jgi:hypothetical protein